MCIIVGRDTHIGVSNTNIFARQTGLNRQLIAYQMEVMGQNDMAMILPIPVTNQNEYVVKFIDLSDRQNFFEELDSIFSKYKNRGISKNSFSFGNTLKVFNVGSFQASVVPTINDFNRLEESFRVPNKIWDSMRTYNTGYSFVVFQLSINSDHTKIHPMAFEFFTSMSNKIYFPTVHYHGGTYKDYDEFDHNLYYQGNVSHLSHVSKPLNQTTIREHRIFDMMLPCHKITLNGIHPNKDFFIDILGE